jgi:mannitol-1-phosphate/altronate dehydrogenase
MSDSRAFLRHTLATIAYRGAKAIRNPGPSFAEYSAAETSRTPEKILAHVGDLMDWGLAMSEGRREWHDSTPLAWEKECERFFTALKKFDDYLASEKPLQVSAEKLFQSAIADALTHIGQIAMLRRMAGVPIRGENYYVADITVGRVGADQAAPRKEFD